MALQLGASTILDTWEMGVNRRPLDRGLTLLWAAGVEGDTAALPLVERDRLLLKLRERNFGARLPLVTTCPNCDATQELEVFTSDLAEALPPPAVLRLETHEIRPTTSRDIAAVYDVPITELTEALRARLLDATIPDALAEEAHRMIEAREEDCALVLSVSCADCQTTWREVLDIVALVWADVAVAARRLLQDVADLARAFGWSETEVLALSDARRLAYLELAGAQ